MTSCYAILHKMNLNDLENFAKHHGIDVFDYDSQENLSKKQLIKLITKTCSDMAVVGMLQRMNAGELEEISHKMPIEKKQNTKAYLFKRIRELAQSRTLGEFISYMSEKGQNICSETLEKEYENEATLIEDINSDGFYNLLDKTQKKNYWM